MLTFGNPEDLYMFDNVQIINNCTVDDDTSFVLLCPCIFQYGSMPDSFAFAQFFLSVDITSLLQITPKHAISYILDNKKHNTG